MTPWTLSLLLLSQCGAGLKFLGYNPIFGHSHANFIGKITDTLHEAGHEVVLLTSVLHTGLQNRTSKHARLIFVPPNDFTKGFGAMQQGSMGRDLWTADNRNIFAMLEMLDEMAKHFGSQCETMLTHPGLIEQLKAEKFDAAFGEAMCFCGFGLFHLVGIEKYAVTQSIVAIDDAGHLTGAPSFPSYVPAMMSSFGDRMSFKERALNMLNTYYTNTVMHKMNAYTETTFLRLHPDVPDLESLIAKSTYFFMNSEPLIDFPRVVSRKIIDIGGISVPAAGKPLEEPFSSLLSARPKTVLISFGSVMMSHHMPESFKETIRETARHFKDVTFIWKYEKPVDDVAAGIPNLHTSTWLPQHDFLRDPRLTAFVTHGGLGSTNEATLTGVPVVAIPVMGDQMRNGKMLERLGNGVLLHKDDLEHPAKLIVALHEVIDTDKYTKRARRVSAMVSEQPQPVTERLVSHFEFMAKYGPLTELDHVGSTLGTVKLYNLDIFAVAGLIILIVITIVIFTFVKLARCISKCVRVVKSKSD